MKIKRALLTLPIFLALSAASEDQLSRKKYIVPVDTAETATLLFPKGNLKLTIYGPSDAQYYGILNGNACINTQRLIMYNAGIGNNTKEKPVSVAAGKNVSFIATTLKHVSGWTGAGTRDQWNTCTKTFNFTPKSGITYIVHQEPDGSRSDFCAISVKEQLSGEVPIDFADGPALSCLF